MDFLFAIPIAILHLISSLFSWIFSIISWLIGIVLLPLKLVWGVFTGIFKFIISVFLAPFLLFSHPVNVPTAQAAVPTVPVIPNSRLEQIFNDIQQLELAGRRMEPLRANGDLAQCGSKMREYQYQAEDLVQRTNDLPIKYKITLGAAATRLKSCVSCSPFAQDSCDRVAEDLKDYQLVMSEE